MSDADDHADPDETEAERPDEHDDPAEVPAVEQAGAADPAPPDAGPSGAGPSDASRSRPEELGDGRLSYECSAWAGESRSMLASLLNSAGVAHVWQGTTLTVREEDEERVDELVDDVLAAARPALDPDAARIVYEVGSWPASAQTALADGLAAADMAYEWDERGDLVVAEADEEAAEAVIDELPEPDDAEIAADDGVAVHELLDALFMASSRLVKHPADPAAIVRVSDTEQVLAQVAVPFGFEPTQWRALTERAAELARMVDEDESVSEASDEELSSAAAELRDLLRNYV